MKAKIKRLLVVSCIMATMAFATSCKKPTSSTTGWNYNDKKTGGYEMLPYLEQETGPGLVLVEGGTFVLGRVEQDITYDWNNIPRRVSVPSFYMDETEVRNHDWLEYLYWINRVMGANYPEAYKKALPDTLVWRDPLAFNEPYVEYYLRHPSYREYPVVGVSWVQATEYCAWRSDRVNEMILIREGLKDWDPIDNSVQFFTTDRYTYSDYGDPSTGSNPVYTTGIPNLNDASGTKPKRKVKMEDGIMLPKYRLPTEAEWEYAAYGLMGNTVDENIINRKLYPWNGHIVRSDNKNSLGEIVANVKRGRGDLMGVAGNLNDAGFVTTPVFSYWPNDYGLYNMAGNVNEWVADVFRPLSFEDVTEYNPYRGNVFKNNYIDPVSNQVLINDTSGQKNSWLGMPGTTVFDDLSGNQNRRNYRYADNINYLDGDLTSSVSYDKLDSMVVKNSANLSENNKMYDYGKTSMINNQARIFKGGSWKDMVYWTVPGTRRFLDENQSTDDIGFRCAMTRVGSPIGNN